MNDLEKTFEEHVAWINLHPNYACRVTGHKHKDYIELLKEMYIDFRRFTKKNGFANKMAEDIFDEDVKIQKGLDVVSMKIAEREKRIVSGVQVDESVLWAFITVGFNEQTVTVEKMVNVSKKIANLKYFKECHYVLEKHRENGIHHHTHFLVKLHKKEYRTKLIGWIYGVRGMKEICLKPEFIDILGPLNAKKVYQPFDTYYDYIRGIKKEDKMKYIALDKKWRALNKIDDLLEKNNV